jgi:hypothetical protein
MKVSKLLMVGVLLGAVAWSGDSAAEILPAGGDCAVAPGTIRVYARPENGTPREIRVLSSNCPVTTEATVTDHGLIPEAENMGWFRGIIEDRTMANDVREKALFALVVSGSNAAYVYLDGLLTRK